MRNTYHVMKNGADINPGTEESPFLTIGKAAQLARAGDTILVHAGEYREWIKPQEGGLSDARRITYQAAEGDKVVIKGSERIQSWEKAEGTVWKAELPKTFFDGYNPYAETIVGDWLMAPAERVVHLGDVYLNGMSFYEAENYEALQNPAVRTAVFDFCTKEMTPVHNPEQTKYVWYAEVDAETTTIYANFHNADPNEELVEINVRPCCFYPDKSHVNYITVRGFEMAHAATPWTPPTGDQPGLIGAHWSKGWIIENNIIHDAKCSAISIGKDASTGDNFRTFRRDKPGYQYQLESVFSALKLGWSKETIGSHIIRNNVIYDCGQNGIVGHLGCVFSQIHDNHIYHIGLKREYFGYEIAGIKLHAAIDVHIHNNRIHDCSLGTWLDWQAQGARVNNNLFYKNNRDLFIEVSHGPYLVDHNILASPYAHETGSQGGAYVGNLFAGKINRWQDPNRSTPYHAPHSTDVAGYAVVYGADDRYYQNIFIGGQAEAVGTSVYDGSTASLEEYIHAVDAYEPCDLDGYLRVQQPAYIHHNVYLNGAQAFDKETDALSEPDFDATFDIEETDDGVYLRITLPEAFASFRHDILDTKALSRVRIPDADFESFDGSDLRLDTDYFGEPVGAQSVAGPIGALGSGENRVKISGV